MRIILLILVIVVLACQTNTHQSGFEKKMFVFETDSCKSLNTMEFYEIDSLSLLFLKPKLIFMLDTPYIMSREIAYLNRVVDATRRNMISIEFIKRNFYESSVTYFLRSIINSATQMSSIRKINLHLYDSFYVAKDFNCGLLVYDRLNSRKEKYYFGNFVFQRPDSIVINIEIALMDSAGTKTMDQVMCMLKSISFKDSTVLLPLRENDRFSNVKYFGAY